MEQRLEREKKDFEKSLINIIILRIFLKLKKNFIKFYPWIYNKSLSHFFSLEGVAFLYNISFFYVVVIVGFVVQCTFFTVSSLLM